MTTDDLQRLSFVFEGWDGYQTSLVHAIEPLSDNLLGWKPSEKLRTIGEIARHIAMGRINWFLRMRAPGSEEAAARVPAWDFDPHGNRYVREADIGIDRDGEALVDWLSTTWGIIDRTLKAWTVEDLAVSYRHVWRGEVYEISRQWTVWRTLAHDIHHGGQIARVLAELGVDAPELRGLGGHIVSPRKVGEI